MTAAEVRNYNNNNCYIVLYPHKDLQAHSTVHYQHKYSNKKKDKYCKCIHEHPSISHPTNHNMITDTYTLKFWLAHKRLHITFHESGQHELYFSQRLTYSPCICISHMYEHTHVCTHTHTYLHIYMSASNEYTYPDMHVCFHPDTYTYMLYQW